MAEGVTFLENKSARLEHQIRTQKRHLRECIDAENQLNTLVAIQVAMMQHEAPVIVREPGGVCRTEHRPLNSDRIAALKVAADISLKLLGKVLPDLKAVEIHDPNGDAVKPVFVMKLPEIKR